MLEPQPLHEWLRAIDATTEWTTSVCTGALLLGAAGLLDGLEATTHWSAFDILATLGARTTERRVVQEPQGVGWRATPFTGRGAPGRAAPDRGRRGRQGDPAGHRVRPTAALRQRFGRQGLARDHGAGAPGDVVVATDKHMNRWPHRGSMGTWHKPLPRPAPPHRPTTSVS